MKLKLTGPVVRDVDLTNRKYLHPNASASASVLMSLLTCS